MSHIIDGRASESEISNFIGGKPVATAYAKDKDNPNAYFYEYWSSIRHPETGERLQAVKGYCNPNDFYQCYYAEYRDDEGNSYHYLDSRYYHDSELRGNKSIAQQQSEDAAELERKLDSKKHEDFFEQSSAGDAKKTSEDHQAFFENTENSSTTNEVVSSSEESNAQSKSNGNINGQS